MAILNERNLKELLDAFGHYFPSDTVYASDKKFKSFYGDYIWGNRKEFIDFIKRLTSVEIENERDIANIKLAQTELVKLSGGVSEKEGQLDSNLPDEQARAQMEEERQRRTEEINKTKVDAERLVRQSIQKKLDLYKQSEKYKSILENKKITVSPKGNLTEINLSKDDKNKLYNLAVSSKDATSFQNAVRAKIYESLEKSPNDVKNNVSEKVVQKSVIDLTEKLSPFAGYNKSEDIPDKIYVYNSSSPIVSLADPNNEKLKEIIPNSELRNQVSESAKAIAIAVDSENLINSDLTKQILENDNISFLLYPKNIANFEISEKQEDQETKDNGIDISLKDIYDNGRDVYDLWGKLFNKEVVVEEVFSTSSIPGLSASVSEISTVTEITPLMSGLLPAVTGPILGLSSSVLARQWLISGAPGSFAQLTAGTSTLYLPSSTGIVLSSSQSLALATPSIANFTGQFMLYSSTKSVGVLAASGVMTNGAKFLAAGVKIGQSSLGIMVGGTGAKIVATGAFAKIGAALGSFAPVVGNIVGAVAGFLFGKLLEKIDWGKVKKFLSDYGGVIAIALLGGGAVFGSLPMVAIGVPLLVASVPLAGGPAGFFSNIAGLLEILMTAFVFRAGKAVIITLITVPIVVAILLLIINSGAYVTPPNTAIGGYYGEHDCSKGIKIVEKAETINKKLQKGFNNYYNKSPDYPNLWNQALFEKNPNPLIQNAVIGSDDMFWCNYTPTKSYQAANIDLPFGLTPMMKYFIDQGKWTSGNNATTKDICPGDTIFFRTPVGAPWLSHVAVVYSVSEDEIITVQSNSPWKHNDYAVNSSGHFPIFGSGDGTIEIVGFGAP